MYPQTKHTCAMASERALACARALARPLTSANGAKRFGTRIKTNQVFGIFGRHTIYKLQHIVEHAATGKCETITSKNDIEVNAIGPELICRQRTQTPVANTHENNSHRFYFSERYFGVDCSTASSSAASSFRHTAHDFVL